MNLETLNETLKNEYALLKEDYDRLLNENESIKKEFEELKKRNADIEAAAAGIKPQNYTEFKGLSSRSSIDRGEYIGKFLGTAYTPSKEECGNDNGITNSGKEYLLSTLQYSTKSLSGKNGQRES